MNKSIKLLQELKIKYNLPSNDIDLIIESIDKISFDKKQNKKATSKVTIKNQIIYRKLELNKNDISLIFNSKSTEEINKMYNLIELKQMYYVVYDFKPLSNKRKLDLIKDIQQHYHSKMRLSSFTLI